MPAAVFLYEAALAADHSSGLATAAFASRAKGMSRAGARSYRHTTGQRQEAAIEELPNQSARYTPQWGGELRHSASEQAGAGDLAS
jgi:hypothetical protein